MLRRHTIIALANCVVVGGDDLIEARSLVDGSVQWTAKVDGTARGLAFAGGRLLVSTDTGMLHCFSTATAAKTISKTAGSATLPVGLAKRLACSTIKRLFITNSFCIARAGNFSARRGWVGAPRRWPR